MTRKNFLSVFAVLAFLSSGTWAQVPNKEKVVASAERAFEKYTKAYVEEFLQAGTNRARQHCKKWLDVGVYHPGCPVQSKYY